MRVGFQLEGCGSQVEWVCIVVSEWIGRFMLWLRRIFKILERVGVKWGFEFSVQGSFFILEVLVQSNFQVEYRFYICIFFRCIFYVFYFGRLLWSRFVIVWMWEGCKVIQIIMGRGLGGSYRLGVGVVCLFRGEFGVKLVRFLGREIKEVIKLDKY